MEIEDPDAALAPAVEAEVRALLEAVRISGDDGAAPAAKVAALRTLKERFLEEEGGQDAYQQMAEHRRAVNRFDGGRRVLLELRRELGKVGDLQNRDVVLEAIRFLANWITTSAEGFQCFLDIQGIRSVRDALNGYLDDHEIAAAAISCFYNYTLIGDGAHLNEFVAGGSLQCMVWAVTLPAHENNELLLFRAVHVVAHLVDGGVPHDLLRAAGAMYVPVSVKSAFWGEHSESILKLMCLSDELLDVLNVRHAPPPPPLP
jgi:hypothetical protein